MMHDKEIIELVKKKRLKGYSLGKIAADLGLPKFTVQNMASNDYNKEKRKRERKFILSGYENKKIRLMARKLVK